MDMRPNISKTHMINWRGGQIEFCHHDKSSLNNTNKANPPWYIIRYKGKYWSTKKWNYIWLDYGGPPKIFLTKTQANKEAKAFHEQYGTSHINDYPPLEIEIITLKP